MKTEKLSVTDRIDLLVQPIADEQELVIWDIEYGKEGGRYLLRITIDQEDGVDLDACEAFHRAIDPILDEADPIAESYTLEVCSPGIERELKNDFHISACEGWDVEVRLYAPVDGKKIFRGVLLESEPGTVRIEEACLVKKGEPEEKTVRVFERKAVAKVQTYFDFSQIQNRK